MQQQINLYRYLTPLTPTYLQIRMLLLLHGVLIALLMIVYFYELSEKHKQVVQVSQLTQELSQSRQRLVELVEKYPQLNLQSQLDNANLLCEGKYSFYLKELAQSIVPGVWLTEFTMTSNGEQFNLSGHAVESKEVQQYLYQLNHMPGFSHLTFVLQELTKSPEETVFNFSIASEASNNHA